MKKILTSFVKLFFSFFQLGSPASEIIAESPPLDRPSATIVGGQDARPGEFPWQVSLQVTPLFGKGYHNCGGSILNETTIISAGHCIDTSMSTRRIEVLAGAHNMKVEEPLQQRVRVRKIAVHPKFDK